MPKLFISYRRADSQYVTDSIYEHMCKHFGADNVFLDVGNIPFGVDFRQYLQEQVQSHDAVLVIIGPEWAKIMQERADQPNDFVRIEIENALQSGKLVIPVLVMGAQMPDFTPLPASIQDLQWRNSAMVRRQPDLAGDCTRLAEGIKQFFGTVARSSALAVPTKTSMNDILPAPFAWINIPAGQVTIQNKRTDLPNFAISKYPITNAQYAEFIRAGGYQEQRWWSKAGWPLRQQWEAPRYWQDAPWNEAEKPVVGVSWYEVKAFCRWLSEASGEKIGLPSEQQWQRAAQGNDGRLYPWGNEWDCTRCNNSVPPCNSSGTTPVTMYEGKGESPFGVVDMIGNVWEWCQPGNNVESAIRGGSWNLNEVRALQTTYRQNEKLETRNNTLGFRCVRVE